MKYNLFFISFFCTFIILFMFFSGCINNNQKNDNNNEIENKRSEKFGVRIAFVNLREGDTLSGIVNITWRVEDLPCADSILVPGNYTIVDYKINFQNATLSDTIIKIPEGDSGNYYCLWNTSGLPDTTECQIRIRIVGISSGHEIIIDNLIISNKKK